LKTIRSRLLEQTRHDFRENIRNAVGLSNELGRVRMQDRVKRIDSVLAGECPLAGDELKQDRSQRKKIRARIHLQAANLLRRQIARSAEENSCDRGRRTRRPRRLRRELGDAKVEDLCDACPREKDVLRLEIAMYQAGRVRGDQASGNVDRNLPRHSRRQRVPIQPGAQRLTFEQLDDDVGVPLEDADVVHLHHIGMIDGRGDPGFTKKPLDRSSSGTPIGAIIFNATSR
jgi:hypothetical protein